MRTGRRQVILESGGFRGVIIDDQEKILVETPIRETADAAFQLAQTWARKFNFRLEENNE